LNESNGQSYFPAAAKIVDTHLWVYGGLHAFDGATGKANSPTQVSFGIGKDIPAWNFRLTLDEAKLWDVDFIECTLK
jgi:hypothetical protein